jgi:hypothetical protein
MAVCHTDLSAASEPDARDELPSIVVASVRSPETIDYKKLKQAEAAFLEHRHLARDASLRFILRPSERGMQLEDVKLSLSSDDESIPIELGRDLSFSIPKPPHGKEDGLELTVNKKKGSVGWIPYVRTPGVRDADLRLGDLRLACEIDWAINAEKISFLLRTAIRAAGGPCKSKHYAYRMGRKMASASITHDGRSMTLPLGAENKLFVPMGLPDWADDSVITVVFQADEASQKGP